MKMYENLQFFNYDKSCELHFRKPEAETFRRRVTQGLLPTLRKYVLPSDLKTIATEMGLTLRHVQKTLSGTTTSYPVMERLVHTGMQNRKKGIHRIERKRYVPLITLFTEEQLNGKED